MTEKQEDGSSLHRTLQHPIPFQPALPHLPSHAKTVIEKNHLPKSPAYQSHSENTVPAKLKSSDHSQYSRSPKTLPLVVADPGHHSTKIQRTKPRTAGEAVLSSVFAAVAEDALCPGSKGELSERQRERRKAFEGF